MDEDGRMPACPAGEHRSAQSHSHLLILMEMLLTREFKRHIFYDWQPARARLPPLQSSLVPPLHPVSVLPPYFCLHHGIVALTLDTDSDFAILQKRFVEEISRKKGRVLPPLVYFAFKWQNTILSSLSKNENFVGCWTISWNSGMEKASFKKTAGQVHFTSRTRVVLEWRLL